jgi:hypothetical protein
VIVSLDSVVIEETNWRLIDPDGAARHEAEA